MNNKLSNLLLNTHKTKVTKLKSEYLANAISKMHCFVQINKGENKNKSKSKTKSKNKIKSSGKSQNC